MPSSADEPPPHRHPITDELDLHTFRPGDLGELIPAYLAAARARGFTSVRIVHGKGTGTLRTTVHTLLAHSPLVAEFALAPPEAGGWGATRVRLHPAGV